MKLGMVTYMWGAKWDLPTLIRNCEQTGFEGVELRTTHAHGVEVTLNQEQRKAVQKRFSDSPVELVGLGTTCDFHHADPAAVKKQVELGKQFIVLSHDVGGTGIKVRPNGMTPGKDRKATAEQIGKALRELGQYAEGYGQEIRLEVHGKVTAEPALIAEILKVADHPSVGACWNSNNGEVVNNSIRANFDLLRNRLSRVVHIHDLYDAYPYRELFALLRSAKFEGFCLSESPETKDPVPVMKYYRVLFNELVRNPA